MRLLVEGRRKYGSQGGLSVRTYRRDEICQTGQDWSRQRGGSFWFGSHREIVFTVPVLPCLTSLLGVDALLRQALDNGLIDLPFGAHRADLDNLPLLLEMVHDGHARLGKGFESLLDTLLVVV